MIAAIYARKSTTQDIAEEAKSVTRQVDGGRAFITTRGWTLDDAHVYTDDGVSGALFANRAEFQRMMRDATAGVFEAVVFYDLDRFGRNARNRLDPADAERSVATGRRLSVDALLQRDLTSTHGSHLP